MTHRMKRPLEVTETSQEKRQKLDEASKFEEQRLGALREAQSARNAMQNECLLSMPSYGYYIMDSIAGKMFKRFQDSPQMVEMREKKGELEERRNRLSNQIKSLERKLKSKTKDVSQSELSTELTIQRSLLSLCQVELNNVVLELTVAEKKKNNYLENRRLLDRMHSSYWGSFPFLENELQFLNLLGYGGQAEVWEAYDVKLGKKVAVKVTLKGSLTKAIAEANLLKELDHPGIIKCYGHRVIDDTTFSILDPFPGKSVQRIMKRDGSIFEEPAIRVIANRLCDIISYIHARDIVHMDITPSNVLVDLTTLEVKLIDFGSFEIMSEKNRNPSQKSATLRYLPAECLNPNKAPLITPAIDVYQFGNILFELLFGVSAFWEDGKRLPDHTKPLQWPTKPVTEEAKDFISSCLSMHDFRPTIVELRLHKYLDLSSPVNKLSKPKRTPMQPQRPQLQQTADSLKQKPERAVTVPTSYADDDDSGSPSSCMTTNTTLTMTNTAEIKMPALAAFVTETHQPELKISLSTRPLDDSTYIPLFAFHNQMF